MTSMPRVEYLGGEEKERLIQRKQVFEEINEKIDRLGKVKHKATVNWSVSDEALNRLNQLLDVWLVVQGLEHDSVLLRNKPVCK